MLIQRIITAAVLAPLILLAIFKLTNEQLAVFFAIIVLIAAWEWANLIGLVHILQKSVYILLIVVLGFVVWRIAQDSYEVLLFSITSIWWILVLFMLFAYKKEWLQSDFLQKVLQISGFIVLIPAWLALIKLHHYGVAMLIFFLFIIWIADIAAYFIGKKFGKTKLAPELSPGKSREGVIGALIASVVVACVGMQIFTIENNKWIIFTVLCVFTALISVVGDLYESLLKRKAGVKDSGKILPGHGGVLDRIDSITAAAPVYVLGLNWVV